MKGLVALVIGMGVLIVVGLIVVFATIAIRLGGSSAGFATSDLPIPDGCQAVETIAEDERLILRLGTGERCNQVLIVDMATGRLLGTLRLVPGDQPQGTMQ